jgi:hypothetical protein
MDWTTTFFGPAVVAAVVSGFITVVGFFVTTRSAMKMHGEKLDLDRELAERKFEFDKDMAERKFRYDRELHDHKRRVELAEDVLASFYKARDIILAARSPGGFDTEGHTRPKLEAETDEEKRELNAIYRVLERLNSNSQFFADLDARRYRISTLISPAAMSAFDELYKIRSEIKIAVRMLFETHRNRHIGNTPQARKNWEASIGWGLAQDDKIPQRLDAILATIENTCRPAIQGRSNI